MVLPCAKKSCILIFWRNLSIKKKTTLISRDFHFLYLEGINTAAWSFLALVWSRVAVWSFFSWHLPGGFVSPWWACHPTHSTTDMPGGCSRSCWQQLCFLYDGCLCGPSLTIVPSPVALLQWFLSLPWASTPCSQGEQLLVLHLLHRCLPRTRLGGRTSSIPSRLSKAKLCCLPRPVWHSALIGKGKADRRDSFG